MYSYKTGDGNLLLLSINLEMEKQLKPEAKTSSWLVSVSILKGLIFI